MQIGVEIDGIDPHVDFLGLAATPCDEQRNLHQNGVMIGADHDPIPIGFFDYLYDVSAVTAALCLCAD
jgi:hypothetical protein